MDVTAASLLSDAYLSGRAALVDPRRAGDPGHGRPAPGGTVCLAAADRAGRMISFIQSNYMGFGSGVVVPGTGISLQNRGAGFTLRRGHPNEVGPRKRPFHTIIPGFATTADGRPLMAFGLMGGPMQAQGHVQLALRILALGQNPQAAADAPRWRVVSGRRLAVEPDMDPALSRRCGRAGMRSSSKNREAISLLAGRKSSAETATPATWPGPTRARMGRRSAGEPVRRRGLARAPDL